MSADCMHVNYMLVTTVANDTVITIDQELYNHKVPYKVKVHWKLDSHRTATISLIFSSSHGVLKGTKR